MLYRDESVAFVRLHVVGSDGEAIGGVEAMYVDEQTDEPEFALVGMGFFRLRHSFVPMADARTEGVEISVPYDKRVVKDAPYIEPHERLDRSEVDALSRHYGLDPEARRAAPTPPSEEGGETQAHAASAGGVQASDHPDPASLEQLTVDELRQLAADRNITGRSTMNKGELVAALGAEDQRDGENRSDADYENRTVEELRRMAAERDIAGRSSMRKGELIDALRGR